MSPIDIPKLLQAVSDNEPAGPDQEYHPTYLAVFRAAEGTPSRQMGETVVAAEEPDWSHVADLAVDLLSQSKDLRVAVLLACALLRVQGLKGLNDGLALVLGLMDRYWQGVHPQLDPDDGDDPTARVNCVLGLCGREHLLDALRTTSLVRSRVFGPIAYRDIEIAEGRSSAPPDGKALDLAAVNGAFKDCDIDELKEAEAAAQGALRQTQAILDLLGERIRTDQMPSLDPLIDLLSAIRKALYAHLAPRLPKAPATAGEVDSTAPSTRSAQDTAQAGGPPGQITSRDDVVRAIDGICDYYARHEPSSPVPLLLQRARRLTTGSFVDIVRDLAPDALGEIEKVCGLYQEQ
jgi:type VI secretion system protein ImpA